MAKFYLNPNPNSITHLKKATRSFYSNIRPLKHGGEKLSFVLNQKFENTSDLSITVAISKLKSLTVTSVNWEPLNKEIHSLSVALDDYSSYLSKTPLQSIKKKILSKKCAVVSKANTKLIHAASELKRTNKIKYRVLIDSKQWQLISFIILGLFYNSSLAMDECIEMAF